MPPCALIVEMEKALTLMKRINGEPVEQEVRPPLIDEETKETLVYRILRFFAILIGLPLLVGVIIVLLIMLAM